MAALAAMLAVTGAAAARGDGAEADGAASAERGRAIAERHCGRCHATGQSDESPLAIAPPLREFAAKWPLDQLEEAFAEGIVTGHPEMPQFAFSPDEISALIIYLDRISERGHE